LLRSVVKIILEVTHVSNTSQRGLQGQTAVLNRLVQLGLEVLLPWGDHIGYDLAYYATTEEFHFGFFVHRENHLVRIQCKVAWLSGDGGSLRFNTSTVSMGGTGVWKKKRSGYRGRADWFGVYSPDTGKVYMISVWDAPDASNMNLRLLPAKNNQEQGVKWAKDYEI
jgi:PD-(D/E)XK endonuclease